MSPEDEDIVFHIPSNLPRIFVHNKIDLTNSQPALIEDGKISHVYISAKHMLGINVLRDKLLQLIGWQNNQGDAFTARTRHLDAMRLTVTHIDNAFANWEDLDLLAEELRYAHSALGTITGDFSVDDLLGEIFSKFCIGK
jgi:tRNA modification GTPase